jgi:DHA1 family multidrug resistance protein-like MFS transporter
MRRGAASLKPERRPLVVVAALVGSTALQWLGAGAVLPLMPLYLRRQGAGDGLVGAVMAGFFVAALLVQLPGGRLADRVGRRPVQMGGLALFALGSVGFLTTSSPLAALGFRALQGAGTGLTQVAGAALIGDVVPEGLRGRAYGALYGGQIGGLAVGPLAGSVLGVGQMAVLFGAAAVLNGLAIVPLVTLVPARAGRDGPRSAGGPKPWRDRGVRGVALAMAASGLVSGMYEVCWTLLLHLRGAASWQIGLSWTLFAVPLVLVAGPAGWLVDRLDRRRLAMAAIVGSAGFAALYPFVDSVAWLVGLGAAEALAVAVGYPAVMAELAHRVPAVRLGEAQGFCGATQTGAIALAASVSGALFGVRPWLPFDATALLMVLCVACLPWVWGTRTARGSDFDDAVDDVVDGLVGRAVEGPPLGP